MRRSQARAAAVLTTAILALTSAASAATDNTWSPKDPKNDFVYTGSKADQKANEKKYGAALAKADVTARFRYNSARHEFVSDIRLPKGFKQPKDAGFFEVLVLFHRPDGKKSKIEIVPSQEFAITSLKCRPDIGRGEIERLPSTETSTGLRVTFPRDCLVRPDQTVRVNVTAKSVLFHPRKADYPVAYDDFGRGSDGSASFLLD
ncbi:hypothetical protein K8Z61_09335 [Nocardioides sp. TRM66260-LWL]|uniref:hypothetical protein n=1 Tax=Nocardioides sp. TRM66260-LWL TaxID=2874478 RepID=UPI001CC4B79B|nr:hypothetical protein [Nocardioides sp. TRM66260-LWL]MBZ5734697.1 hypothetical protein [Nocardioides sp. TRM66260-LWL]